MINLTNASLKIHLALKPTDMRKSFNGIELKGASMWGWYEKKMTTPPQKRGKGNGPAAPRTNSFPAGSKASSPKK